MRKTVTIALLFIMSRAGAQTLELSGRNWDFMCTGGRNANTWTTIPVPSCWELQGFGKYNYGLDKDTVKGREQGLYRYKFTVPKDWSSKTVKIVFDGSMTDTRVRINGRLAGPDHQGAFYRFSYDITPLLRFGRQNLLEVTVSKMSANRSVNQAERHGDFWIFGGIFRPVYLKAYPKVHIDQVAIDAKADGTLMAACRVTGDADAITAQVFTLDGKPVGAPFEAPHGATTETTLLRSTVPGILPWSPEAPQRYKLICTLTKNGRPLDETATTFGFRTVELRPHDGIYVNGVKIKFKGICHHSFWPTTGRTTTPALSVEDVELIKDMNMNAVRMSHYPPDEHFLDACDSLGVFVLDELTGWHHAYDTEVGTKLVGEMIERDVNHPSVVIWDNGNEGGFNFDLDPLFDSLDIQRRPLIHPWAVFRHTDTQHYINYDYGNGTGLHGHEVTFPTEFLHALYDGGGGAGLQDYWEQMWADPLSAGGFIWDFSDEAVVRTDKKDSLDTDGDHAPDGVLGPYREKEGSFYTIKAVWSPVHIERKEVIDGRFTLENRYFYTNLDKCRFTWKMRSPTDSLAGDAQAPDIKPSGKGVLDLNLPVDRDRYDVLYLTAYDPYGRLLNTWSWPLKDPAEIAARMVTGKSSAVNIDSAAAAYTVTAGALSLTFDRHNARLTGVRNAKGAIPFGNGPLLCDTTNPRPESFTTHYQGDSLVLEAIYAKASNINRVKWTICPSGWVKLDVAYFPVAYNTDYMGVSFSYPESAVKAIRWMGDGPYRVWKDRMEGPTLGVWDKAYNNTITGQGKPVYPEFKGYYSNFYWMRLQTGGQPVTVVCASPDVFLRLYTPAWPAHAYHTAPPFPVGDISFMHAIPPIGTKSQAPENMGPMGHQNMYYDYGHARDYAKRLTLFFNFSGE